MEWFALYVKSRHEFVTNGELIRKGFDTFLPFVRKTRHWKDRKKTVDFVLFPGYLFVHIHPENDLFYSVLKARGAVRLISAEEGRPTAVSQAEIDTLRLLLASGQDFDIYPHLKEGTSVRIARGPLKGAEGVLVKKEDRVIFLVNIKLLGRSAAVRIHADCIE